MLFASRLVVALALSGLFAAPLCADIIPSRYAAKSDAREKVQARLTDLGVDGPDARVRALRLTEEEALYFARHTERVQFSGQEMWAGQADNLWWETIGGAFWLIVGLFAIHHFAFTND
jgi:hypothetical protein